MKSDSSYSWDFILSYCRSIQRRYSLVEEVENLANTVSPREKLAVRDQLIDFCRKCTDDNCASNASCVVKIAYHKLYRQ